MERAQSSVFFGRDDTFFGVCTALGEDFGFNRLWLRLAFAASIYFFPLATIAVYFGLGLLVAFTRWWVPNPRVTPDAEPAPAAVAAEDAPADRQMELALAA